MGCDGCDGSDWRSGKAGCYQTDDEQLDEEVVMETEVLH